MGGSYAEKFTSGRDRDPNKPECPRPMAAGFRSFDTCLPIFQVECLQVVTRDGNRYSAN